jgi:predicted dehydrogenase
MRLLIVGFGSMGKRHAANALALGHQVVVYDADDDRMTAASLAGFDTLFALATDNVDAAVIATPASDHAATAARLLEQGYRGPLFVEKPLDVDLTREAFWASWPHPTTMVGYNWRYHPQVLAWRRENWASDGQPAWLQLICNTRMADWPGRDYAEPILELSHEIDLLRWFHAPDEPRLVRSGPFATGGCWLQFATGDLIDLRWNAPPSRQIFASWTSGRSRWLLPQFAGPKLEQSYRDEMVAFLQFAADGVDRGHCDLDDGLAMLRICEQAKALAYVQ